MTFDIIFSAESMKDIHPVLCQMSRPDPIYPRRASQQTYAVTPSLTLPPRGGGVGGGAGFTLLELIIVLFLITLILGLSTLFFANTLPSNRLNATVRHISATIKQARSLAQIHSQTQVVTIDIEAKKYGIEGYGFKDIPSDISIKVIDPMSGEIEKGKYYFVSYAGGNIEGGTIVLWNSKKTVSIQLDPIVGSVVIKE